VIYASIPSPTRSVWHLGPVPLRAYALCILLGVVVAVWLTDRRLRARGGPEGAVVDVAVWAVPFGIVGARIYHVVTSPDAYFGDGGHPWEALRIWGGGLGIWGAIAGGAIGAWIACRRRGIPLRVVADAAAPGIVFAQAIGRFGNYFNNELYGRETSLPWALRVNAMGLDGHADGALPGTYHPTFLYEVLWCTLIGAVLLLIDRQGRIGHGRLFALYVMMYTVGRAYIEHLRIDEAHQFFGLRLNEWTSLVVFLGGLAYFLLVRGGREHLVVEEAGEPGDPGHPDHSGQSGEVSDAEVSPEEPGTAEPSAAGPSTTEPSATERFTGSSDGEQAVSEPASTESPAAATEPIPADAAKAAADAAAPENTHPSGAR
jgi:prolipoprotein diacylglyceryl transferase